MRLARSIKFERNHSTANSFSQSAIAFQLIAGDRRWRQRKALGLNKVSAIVVAKSLTAKRSK